MPLLAGDLDKFKVIQSMCQEFFNKTTATREQTLKADAQMTSLIEAEKEMFKKTLILSLIHI